MMVALYVRVSTQEQNPDMQKKALLEKAEREG
ncbi:MAG: recombinase family protein [Actinobacteria bacterium]|nr:recombinase family protein [Actinomycetota bacterium]MBE3122662.1 recombinase family protein [Thermoplasmata archaeon]